MSENLAEIENCLPSPHGAADLGLYVHVPFCGTTCDFCAFHQQRPERGEVSLYLEGISLECNLAPSPRQLDTWFWGGGTPGLLNPGQLEQLGKILLSAYGSPLREWTVEMTPASVTPERLKVLRDLGVNRISMGVQSFSDQTLERLGRPHPRKRIFQAFDRLRAAGFENINIDLIFAIPGQDWIDWREDLDQFLALQAEHLSTYCLTFEEDTVLWWKLTRGEIRRDEAVEADLYLQTPLYLEERGLHRYEVSNYARPGRASLHNIGTWNMGEWIGLGPSAASQQSSSRGTNLTGLDRWIKDLRSGRRASVDRDKLSLIDLAWDALIFGLRMAGGVDLDQLAQRFHHNWSSQVLRYLKILQKEGLVESRSPRCFSLTNRGFLVVDRIGSDLLAFQVEDD